MNELTSHDVSIVSGISNMVETGTPKDIIYRKIAEHKNALCKYIAIHCKDDEDFIKHRRGSIELSSPEILERLLKYI